MKKKALWIGVCACVVGASLLLSLGNTKQPSKSAQSSSSATSAVYAGAKHTPASSKQAVSSVSQEEQSVQSQPSSTGGSSSSAPIPDAPSKTPAISAAPEKETKEEPKAEAALQLVSVTSPVSRNQTATVVVKGKPHTTYSIDVYYSSGASKASGLSDKQSDTAGEVCWSWKVGGKTKAGTFHIQINGGRESLRVPFTVS